MLPYHPTSLPSPGRIPVFGPHLKGYLLREPGPDRAPPNYMGALAHPLVFFFLRPLALVTFFRYLLICICPC